MFGNKVLEFTLVAVCQVTEFHDLYLSIFSVNQDNSLIFPEGSLDLVQFVFKFAEIGFSMLDESFHWPATSLIKHGICDFFKCMIELVVMNFLLCWRQCTVEEVIVFERLDGFPNYSLHEYDLYFAHCPLLLLYVLAVLIKLLTQFWAHVFLLAVEVSYKVFKLIGLFYYCLKDFADLADLARLK